MSELKRELQEFSRAANELKAVWNKMSDLDRKERISICRRFSKSGQ